MYPALTSQPLTSKFIKTELVDCNAGCVFREHFIFNFDSVCPLSIAIGWSLIRIFAVDSGSCICDVPINFCNNSGVLTIKFSDDTFNDGLARLLLGSASITRFGRLFATFFDISKFVGVLRDGEGLASESFDTFNVVV